MFLDPFIQGHESTLQTRPSFLQTDLVWPISEMGKTKL